MVYSPLDALALAERMPERQVVFLAVGFETTAPSTAVTLLQASQRQVKNFSVFCNHVTIVPPLKAILDSPGLDLDGFLGPATSRRSSARARTGSSPSTTAVPS